MTVCCSRQTLPRPASGGIPVCALSLSCASPPLQQPPCIFWGLHRRSQGLGLHIDESARQSPVVFSDWASHSGLAALLLLRHSVHVIECPTYNLQTMECLSLDSRSTSSPYPQYKYDVAQSGLKLWSLELKVVEGYRVHSVCGICTWLALGSCCSGCPLVPSCDEAVPECVRTLSG